ncbi:hypothetical protein GCM10009735_20790 [Actinomadura chokoriensis]
MTRDSSADGRTRDRKKDHKRVCKRDYAPPARESAASAAATSSPGPSTRTGTVLDP